MGGIGDLLKVIGERAPEVGQGISRGGLAAFDVVAENPEIIPNIEKLRADEEPELFTHIFGIPTPFMQLGTYMGVEGWKGLAVDILADPTNLLGGLGTISKGARTGGKLARGIEGAETVAKGSRRAAEAAQAAETAKGLGELSGAEKAAEAAFHPPQAAELLKELAFKKASAETKTNALLALAKRSAQLDTYGHQQLQDLLSLADDERQAVDFLDQLQSMRGRREVAETVDQKGRATGRFQKWRPGERATFEKPGKQSDTTLSMVQPGFRFPQQAHLGRPADEAMNPLLQHLPGRLELDGLRKTILTKGLDAGRESLQGMIDTRKDLSALVRSFGEAGSVKEAMQIAKQIDKLEPNRAFQVLFGKDGRRNWTNYFKQAAKGAVPALGRTAEQQMALKQRNLLTIAIPFIPGSERVIATGAPVLEAFDKAVNAVKASGIGKAFTRPKASAYAGAAAQVASKVGAYGHIGSFDTIQDFTEQMILSFAGGGLGTPEKVDDVMLQHWAMKDHSLGLSAALGDDVRSAVAGKDDLYRLALENKDQKYFKTTGLKGDGYWGQLTHFTRDKLKPEFQNAFTDLDLANMQAISQRHIYFNRLLESSGMLQEAIEGYIPRLVKRVSKEKEFNAFLHAIPARMTVGKSHFRERTIPFLEDLMELERKGVVELEHDFGKIEAHWANEVLQTAGRKRLYERLQAAKVPLKNSTDLLPLAVRGKSKTFLKHGDEYTKTVNPFVIRAFYPSGGAPRELYLHKKYSRELEVAFGGQPLAALRGIPREQQIADALTKINSVTKRSVMGSDVVNYGWFTERAGGTLGRQWLSSPIAQTRMGAYHRARATDIWDLAYKSGLKGQPIEQDLDTYVHMLDKAAQWADQTKIPLVGRALRGWRQFSAGVEGAAWNYFHPSLKMQAFSELYEKALFDPRFKKIPMQEIAQGVAAHVNNAFSGQNWERLWVGGPGQKWLRLMFVAPDWMLSTVKLGADLFANQTARLPFLGRDMVAPSVRAAYARDYALRAGIFTFGFLEAVNLATSSDLGHFLKTGRLNGHFMADNEEGHKAQLQLPFEEDGKPLYWMPMKQWQDFSSAVNVFGHGDPFKFFGNRIGLVPSAFQTVVNGRDSFGYPIVSTKDGFAHKLADRLGWLASSSLIPSYAQTMVGVGSASARPIRGALEFAGTIRTGQGEPEKVETPEEVINLENEPAPPPDPIPPEYEQALQQELEENPSYLRALNEHLRRMSENNVNSMFDLVRERRAAR